MQTHADKNQENQSRSTAAKASNEQKYNATAFQFVDNRPEAVAQRKLQEMANNSPRTTQLRAFQEIGVKTNIVQQVVDGDHESPGRSRAALKVMNGIGGNQLTNTLFGFGANDTVADLRINARRLVAQFLPHGGTVRIQNNNGDILDDDVLLIQDEQYTATPIPAPPPVVANDGDSGSESDEDEYNEHGQVRPSGGMFFMDL